MGCMERIAIIETIGREYHTPNIENGEYSYVQDAGSMRILASVLGRTPRHYKLDIRFEFGDIVILIETKQNFRESDELQLREYVEEERALHHGRKIIAILANTADDRIKVWRSEIDDAHFLPGESVLDSMEHYKRLFDAATQNDRERVMKNTYDLNELLHRMDIDEAKRSQFVGTTLLYIKDMVKRLGCARIDDATVERLNGMWAMMDDRSIRAAIASTLTSLLDGSENKTKKVELLQRNVLEDQKVKRLSTANWITILDTILKDIYRYIDADSSEGQDILNLFFIAFNKYTGKADKNQAFTPDHITDFMCKVTDVDRTKVVMDITCGSGSFLVQAMVKELADCHRGAGERIARTLQDMVKRKHIFGIENEEKAYGLATTNMLIHGDGNSNIKFASCFDCTDFIIDAKPDVILMNPPYNAKPIGIPAMYKRTWSPGARNGKEDPTKGFAFIHFLSDVVEEMNRRLEEAGQRRRTVKLAVLLPVSAAIGSKEVIQAEKVHMLEKNTLDAVFTLPNEIFYPGASASACCMVFTLGRPHVGTDGTANKTFFGYCKEDGFKKKKNLGRVEQFDSSNRSKWKTIENRWLSMYRNKEVVDGLSSMAVVTGNDEWLCEAYMKTDYSTLCEEDFQRSINNYLAYLIVSGAHICLAYRASSACSIDLSEWKRFRLDRLFEIKKGKRLTADDQEEGRNIYVGAIDSNNGVANRIAQTPIHSGNTISLSYNGSVGEAFYQPDPYWATDDVNVLYPRYEGFNSKIGLFVASVIRKEKYRFSYGRKWTLENMKSTEICLPVRRNRDGTPVIDVTMRFSSEGYMPDWQFMEDYIKALPYGDKI